MPFMKNEAIEAHARFPDEPGVQEHWEARGWVVVEEPIEEPFVPRPENLPADEFVTFVTMWHPEARAAHDFPNNPGAIQGAQDAGWTLELPPAGETPESAPETAEETPARKRRKKETEEPANGSENSEEV